MYTVQPHVALALEAHDNASILNVLSAKTSEVITVSNDVARYALTNVQAGQLIKVISSGMTYIGFPADAAVKFGVLAPGGSAIITIPCYSSTELQTVTLSAGELVYASDVKKLYIGSGFNNVEVNSSTSASSYLSSYYVPHEHMMGITDAPNSPVSITLRSTTGYAAIKWWDASTAVGGTGVPNSDITLTKTFSTYPGGGAGNLFTAARRFYAWSTASSASTAILSGSLTKLSASYMIHCDVSKCLSLTSFESYQSAYTSLNLTANSNLTSILCTSRVAMDELDLSGNHLLSLSSYNITNSKVSSINISGNTAITNLYSSTFPYTATTLNVSGCSSLRKLYLTSENAEGYYESNIATIAADSSTFSSTNSTISLYISDASLASPYQSAMTIDSLYNLVKNLRYFSPYSLNVYIDSGVDTHLISSINTSPYFANGVNHTGLELMNLMKSKNISARYSYVNPLGGTVNGILF